MRGLHAVALGWLKSRPSATRDEFVLAMAHANADDFRGLTATRVAPPPAQAAQASASASTSAVADGGTQPRTVRLAADPRAMPSFSQRTGYSAAEMEQILDEMHEQWVARRRG